MKIKLFSFLVVCSLLAVLIACPQNNGHVPTPNPEPTPTVLKNFTVTFNKNAPDATGRMTGQTFTEGVPQKLTKNNFKRTDYTFKGWATSASGTEVYNDQEEITITEDTILYAVWEAPIITYEGNGEISGNTTIITLEFYGIKGTADPEVVMTMKRLGEQPQTSIGTYQGVPDPSSIVGNSEVTMTFDGKRNLKGKITAMNQPGRPERRTMELYAVISSTEKKIMDLTAE